MNRRESLVFRLAFLILAGVLGTPLWAQTAKAPCCQALAQVGEIARQAMLEPPGPGNLGQWKTDYGTELAKVKGICTNPNAQKLLDALIRMVNRLDYLQPGGQPGYISRTDRRRKFARIQIDLDDMRVASGCEPSAPTASSASTWPCPGTDNLEKISTGASRAATVARAGASVAKDKDIETALVTTAESLEKVTKTVDRVAGLANACGLVRDFVTAIQTINSAGCDSVKLAKGFDQLFRTAGAIGKKLPLDPFSKKYFDLLARNQDFFQRTSANLNPEQRWARQFQGIEGYVPGGCN